MARITMTGLQLALARIGNTTTADSIGERLSGLRYCLADCADTIHDDNRKKGWWTNLQTGQPLQRNVGELLMLMVSELAEIPEGAAALVEMDDKLTHRLMFEAELADCAIRIFDTAGALAPSMLLGFLHAASRTPQLDHGYLAIEQDRDLMGIVRSLAQAMEHDRKKKNMTVMETEAPGLDIYLGVALHGIFHLAKRNSLVLAATICEKLEFNRTREDHMIEHRRAAHGKAY